MYFEWKNNYIMQDLNAYYQYMFTADQGVYQVQVTDLLVPGAPYFESRLIHADLHTVIVVLLIMLASVTSFPP